MAGTMFASTDLTDRALRTKLRILKRTIKLRGVDCSVLVPKNPDYELVHGFSYMDPSGDYRDQYESKIVRLILNFNNFDPLANKSDQLQVIYHYEPILNLNNLIKYSNESYEYMFKVTDIQVYGERNTIYQYELTHLKTICLRSLLKMD